MSHLNKKLMKITNKNKDVLQSYIMTTAKYSFSAYEKRVLYRIVEVLQAKTQGLKLNYNYTLQEDLFKDTEFTMPISCFLKDENDTNYKKIKKALRDLRNKSFEYEDDEHWGVYGIIEMPKIKKYDSFVTFKITSLLMGAFLNFSKGHRKYELETAMQFESVYAMRFYELFSNKSEPIIYSAEELKKMFSIEDKYKKINDFLKRVVEPAKKEMSKKSPYSFKYETIKTGRKITHLKFKPYFIPKNRDPELERKNLKNKTSVRWFLNKETKRYLEETFDFTDKGLKNNTDLLNKAVKQEGFKDKCQEINGMIRKFEGQGNPVKSKPAFFIAQLKKGLEG